MEDWKEGYQVVISQEIHWGDMDAFQHVNNKVYFRFFEDARLAFLQRINVMEFMQRSKIGPILASTSCDYRAPVLYPDTVHIASRVHDLQAKRVSMDHLVFSEQQQKVVADGTSLMVFYDFNSGKSTEIPTQIVEQIKAIQQE